MKNIIKLFLVLNIILTNLNPSYFIFTAKELKSTQIVVSADEKAIIDEEGEPYTNNQLYTLFNVTHNAGVDRTLEIDQSAVDYDVPGSYEVSFTVTDNTDPSNTDTAVSTLVIEDLLPTMSLTSDDIHHHVGIEPDYIADFGLVATEVETGDLTSEVVVDSSAVNYMESGDYPVYFTVSDEEGNVANHEATAHFSNDAPTVNYLANATTSEETPLSSAQMIDLFEVVASDDDGIQKITVDQSAVDYSTPGSYDVYFQAFDIYGAYSTEKHAILNVEDVLPTLTCDQEIVSINETDTVDYVSLFNVVASEIEEGDLTNQIEIEDSNVNLHLPGDYPVLFTVSDEENNEVSCISTLNIIYTAPTIDGLNSLTLKEENPKSDKELIELFDIEYSAMGEVEITVDQSKVDYSTPGSYEVVFTITDNYDSKVNFSSTLVIEDVLPSINSLVTTKTYHIGSNPQYIEDFGLEATEFKLGDLNSTIEIDDSKVNLEKVGTYNLSATATDSDGNTVSISLEIIVENDAPVISGNKTKTITENDIYTESELLDLFNIKVTDTDKIESIELNIDSIDFDAPGNYPLTVIATDEYGASSNYQVNLVIEDVIPILKVPNRISFLHIGDSIDFLDAYNYSATEFSNGDLTSAVEIDDSEVNYDQIGPYTVYFTVADNDGNTVTKESLLVITDDSPVVDGLLYAESPEDLVLSEQDILHLFDIQITDQDAISDVTADLSDIDFYTPDSYYVGFEAVDEYGAVGSVYYAELKIVDAIPVIETEKDEVTIHIGDKSDLLALFGVISSEHELGDLTIETVVDDSAVDYNQTGVYTVTFTVTDNDGNTVNREVTLNIENDNPQISGNDIKLTEETSYSDEELLSLLGIEVTDRDQISSIDIDQSQIDYKTPGVYSVDVIAQDEYFANSTESLSVEIEDVLPTIESQLTEVTIDLGQEINITDSYGLVASEINSGDLTDKIIIDDGNVDYQTSGTYQLTVSVLDEENNEASLNLTLNILDESNKVVDTDLDDSDDFTPIDNKEDDNSNSQSIKDDTLTTTSKTHIKNMLVLQATGRKILITLASVVLLLIILIILKRVVNTDK